MLQDEGEPRKILTVRQVAALFGVHPATLRRWESTGLIAPATRRRRIRVYSPEDVVAIERVVFSRERLPNQE
jgi:DNA-binding transcriptional MerR regulator